MQVFFIISLLIAIGAVTFALQNPGVVVIQFLAWQFQGSLALILLLTFALGFLSSFLLSLATMVRRRLRNRPPDAPAPKPDDREVTTTTSRGDW